MSQPGWHFNDRFQGSFYICAAWSKEESQFFSPRALEKMNWPSPHTDTQTQKERVCSKLWDNEEMTGTAHSILQKILLYACQGKLKGKRDTGDKHREDEESVCCIKLQWRAGDQGGDGTGHRTLTAQTKHSLNFIQFSPCCIKHAIDRLLMPIPNSYCC